ncbi:MAG: Asp-tRNA(Asn)/Glu-tRNA(Gln) amidotransferase subunit GatC [Gammaproteobacteria bacterium]|nr:Asp-tRNA(Asn)/Glu-tRNA(Gln) amidotransferase subunit GatC [Gammaproteobacteria bacterium]
MSLSRKEMNNIAHLARLEISEEEVAVFADNLSRIIDFVEQLSKASTDDVLPMAHPLDMAQRLRADEVTETDHHLEFQQNAANVEDGLYLVPKVLE